MARRKNLLLEIIEKKREREKKGKLFALVDWRAVCHMAIRRTAKNIRGIIENKGFLHIRRVWKPLFNLMMV